MSKIKDEVKKCFKENPNLIHKKLEDIAEFFYLQGLLYQSNCLEAMKNKYIHFQKHLDDESLERATESWKESGV